MFGQNPNKFKNSFLSLYYLLSVFFFCLVLLKFCLGDLFNVFMYSILVDFKRLFMLIKPEILLMYRMI